jgi:hypothetical protein
VYNGSNWVNAPPTVKLTDLSDVSGIPSVNDAIGYNGTGWVTTSVNTSLSGLGDVNTSGAVTSDALVYDEMSSEWVSVALPTVDVEALNDVVLTSPVNGDALVYDGTNWVNQTVGVSELDDLIDATITAPADDNVLKYNGSEWTEAGFSTTDITNVSATVATNGQVFGMIDGTIGSPIWAPMDFGLHGSETGITFVGGLSGGIAPTKGTTYVDKITWVRYGKFVKMEYFYGHTTAGTLGLGDYVISLPTGFAFSSDHPVWINSDTTQHNLRALANAVGQALRFNGNTSATEYGAWGCAVPRSTTSFRIFGRPGNYFKSTASPKMDEDNIVIRCSLMFRME